MDSEKHITTGHVIALSWLGSKPITLPSLKRLHKVFGDRPHNPSKFRHSPYVRVVKILRRGLDSWILILCAQVERPDWPQAFIRQAANYTVLKTWLMNINKTNRRYWKASKWRQRCLINSHKLNLRNSMIHTHLIYCHPSLNKANIITHNDS